jgi:kinesin family member 2/24
MQHTDDIYTCALRPLLPILVKQGIVTCFAYGQTGSGKTYTMNGLQMQLVNELFEVAKKHAIYVCYFEIYGGRCLDLLNDKALLNIMEDKNGNIQIPGLTEQGAGSAKELLLIMEQANSNRTTHATTANDTSSRSHAICQVAVGSLRSISKREKRTPVNWC